MKEFFLKVWIWCVVVINYAHGWLYAKYLRYVKHITDPDEAWKLAEEHRKRFYGD